MKVSVIVPVFNASKFLIKSITSAILQEYCKEIILVDDGSTDDSLLKCSEFARSHNNVRVYNHNNNQNLGPAATRNLGLQKAKGDFIAFLDADDYYLPDFFNRAQKIFENDNNVNMVFGSINAHYYSETAQKKHLDDNERDLSGLLTSFHYQKSNLLYELLSPQKGHLLLSGIIFKKSLIYKTGQFDEFLIQSEDTDFIWRASFYSSAVGLDPKYPVAIKGVHDDNSVFDTSKKLQFRRLLYKKWLGKIISMKLSGKLSLLIIRKHLSIHPIVEKCSPNRILQFLVKPFIILELLVRKPGILVSIFRN